MMEENLPGLMKKLSSSPSRSPASSRGAPSARHRSAPARKPPEPLRRAVADCLSASSPHHSLPSSSEAARIFRDYISSPQTVDVAYNVLVEHAVSEKDRSPAVVARCVALLRRYLLRYIPKEQTLQQIDLFCMNSIAECNTVQRTSGLNATTPTSTSVAAGSATPSSLPPTAYASTALVKSLIYVRSLLSRHIPRRSFQPAAFSGATASKQPLPSLSSLLTKSFNSQLKPGSAGSVDSPDRRDISSPPAPQQLISEEEKEEEAMYTFSDVLKWRWCLDGEQLQASVASESEGVQQEHTAFIHKFVDVGAAALLVGDMEAKIKGHSLKYPSVKDISGLHKLLQPAAVTAVANLASAPSHLKAITFVKRVKPGSFQPWEDTVVATFRPRARPLFQYRPYSEQQPLWLNSSEIGEVMAAVCSDETLPSPNVMLTSSRLTSHMGKPSIDIAVSVLVKLVIDMYILDSQTAAPLTLSLLEDMLRSSKLASRIRVFDLILNLGVHGHLLEPMFPEICSTIEEASEMSYNNDEDLAELRKKNSFYMEQSPSNGKFESWMLSIFYEVLLLMVQTEEREEIVWASALSCLLYFVCDKGKIYRKRLEGLDIRVVKLLLEISWQHSWAELVRNKLVSMLTNMLYLVPNGSVDGVPGPSIFAAELVDLLGGMDYVCLEYSRSSSENDKRNLFLVFFDYAMYQINESCASHGDTQYSFDEVFPIVAMLNLADAPEAFYISVKHGLDGIGEILRRSISEALMRYPNFDRLNTLLEKVMGKYDASISSFASIDKEFSSMIRLTKSCKYLKSIEDGYLDFETASKVKLSWATLHSLLHSEQMACRHNGYIWLLELLVSEISEDGKMSIWHNINTLRDKIGIAGQENSLTDSSVPLPIWILCGLLKSKHPFIKWGFLFVLEKLLMRWKLLLDENKVECMSKHGDISSVHNENRLEEANAVVDLLTSALSLVVQNNETDRINILKMCNIIFSQLCVRISSEAGKPLVGIVQLETKYGTNEESITDKDKVEKIQSQPRVMRNNRSQVDPMDTSFIYETASMAALVLKGHAVVPMRLVARIRPSLFYWPLMQLASDATDDIALGVAVGSKGRANLPGATSDIRAALLLLLIGRCTENASAFEEVGGEEFFRTLLDDTDSRVAYYSSAFLLKRLMTEDTDKYQHLLQNLILKAQQGKAWNCSDVHRNFDLICLKNRNLVLIIRAEGVVLSCKA